MHTLFTFNVTKAISRTLPSALQLLFGAAILASTAAKAQTVDISLQPDHWNASDSIRFEPYLNRPSLYINKGVALARDVSLGDGTLEYDIAATTATSFFGVVFRARALNQTEVVFFRPNDTGTSEAVQYGPALNGVVAAWQIYHGDGANATVKIDRERWTHVRLELKGVSATLYYDGATSPTLVIPRLAGTGGTSVGVWTGAYGRGAYFSNIRFTPRTVAAVDAAPQLPTGTLAEWDLSNVIDATSFTPGKLPDLKTMSWQRARVEPQGFVLVNRYLEAPAVSVPRDPVTRTVLVDSVMSAHIVGAKVVYARTVINSDRDEVRRLHYGYSDGMTLYLNGQPLLFAMSPQNFRNQGVMETMGDAVYLPLKKGRNELTVAVLEIGGGWAFWTRLDGK